MPLYITEYSRLAGDSSGNIIPTGQEPARQRQQVSIAVTQAASQPIDSASRFVRLHVTEACMINFGRNGQAADAIEGHRMPAGAIEFFGVEPNAVISVIATA